MPLALCTLSPLNPRQETSAADIASLAASIRTVGLMQNLAGLEQKGGHVEIVAGGRRLRALCQIAQEDGADTLEVTVPVLLARDEAEAQTFVSADPDCQMAAFEALSGTWAAQTAEHIRRHLMSEAVDPTDRLARFVGKEAYEANGGAVREDLFGEDVYFLDPDLLTALATEKLEREAEAHRSQGWAWVETAFERPSYEVTSVMGRTYPAPVDVSEADAARYDALAALVDADTASDEEFAEFEALAARLEETRFSPEQMALAGVLLWVGYDGTIQAEYGLVRTEDRAAAEEAGICQPSRYRAEATPPRIKGPYSGALSADLGILRTGALQTALLDHPGLALDLITFVLATPVAAGATPLGITASPAPNMPKTDPGLKLPKALRGAGSQPLDAENAAKAFAAFCRKKPETKTRLLTEAVARLLSVGLAGADANPFGERIAKAAGLDLRRVWTPSEGFLGRLKSDQLDAIMAHISGAGVPGGFAKKKKGEKARRLAAIFAAKKGIPPLSEAQRARADAWVPEGMMEAPDTDDVAASASEAA